VGVQREVEVGLQRRLRRELQVEPLIICLVQPAPAGTPAYKGRADAEPESRPVVSRSRGGRGGDRPERVERSSERGAAAPQPQRQLAAVGAAAAPVQVASKAVATTTAAPQPEPEAEPAGRIRRRRSAAS
jgi:ribonuclease J